jgi:hypothetical protein
MTGETLPLDAQLPEDLQAWSVIRPPMDEHSSTKCQKDQSQTLCSTTLGTGHIICKETRKSDRDQKNSLVIGTPLES